MLIKFIYIVLICASCSFFSKKETQVVEFAGENWEFPSTVGKAVIDHKLDYKPPAFYYKNFNEDTEVILSPNLGFGDVDNEYQPKESLYGNTVNGYIFRFPSKQETYDSLRTLLETRYNKKFILTKGVKDIPAGITMNEDQKNFAYDFLTVNNKLTIGIHKNVNRVVVRYMYDLSLEKMGVKMSNYLND
ncbi:hypothetical protein [Dyadobacter endophyticus]|uniref:hypothetical protein n=1 Tax=Dyadobacter endophyticus TaxID=1749036 RepID=UPI001664FF9D|nr:hypothetical protein [Dyadobacter endophyticus]